MCRENLQRMPHKWHRELPHPVVSPERLEKNIMTAAAWKWL